MHGVRLVSTPAPKSSGSAMSGRERSGAVSRLALYDVDLISCCTISDTSGPESGNSTLPAGQVSPSFGTISDTTRSACNPVQYDTFSRTLLPSAIPVALVDN